MRAMRKLIGDPLVHFLLIGAVLFVVLSWYSTDSDPQQIRLSEEQIRNALRSRLPQGQMTPDAAELEALIEPLIRDEIRFERG
jgi:hypothetical protein